MDDVQQSQSPDRLGIDDYFTEDSLDSAHRDVGNILRPSLANNAGRILLWITNML